jgi:glycerol-3-phosphate dehydrogenase
MKSKKEPRDVVIIGGGAIGCAIAQRLSRYQLSVLIMEKNSDLCFGGTKGTHAIVHSGLPAENCPLMNRLVVQGNSMFDEMCKNFDVPFIKTGKLLIALNEEDLKILKNIKEAADKTGVPNSRIVNQQEVRKMEPKISEQVISALYTPTTGFVSAWGLTFALAENAMDNGVQISLNSKVKKIQFLPDQSLFEISTNEEKINSRYIINCAGLYADQVAEMVGDTTFHIKSLHMERYVLDERIEFLNHLVRSPRTSDFISPTKKEVNRHFSNILLGQTADPVQDRTDTQTTQDGLQHIIDFAISIFPNIRKRDIITGFAGLVALNSRTPDYIIEPSREIARLINVSIGGSGVSAAPAIAVYVENLLNDQGIVLEEKKSFHPYRQGIVEFRNLSPQEKENLIKKDSRYGHVVCRCETVTEGEIVEAIRRGARTLDGVKYRTRAGMGRCQAGFCTPRVLEILSRELDIPVTDLTKKGKNSILLPLKAKEIYLKKTLKEEKIGASDL